MRVVESVKSTPVMSIIVNDMHYNNIEWLPKYSPNTVIVCSPTELLLLSAANYIYQLYEEETNKKTQLNTIIML